MSRLWSKLRDGLWRTRIRARLAMAFGRLWPLLVLPLSVAGLYLAISWFGLFRLMPEPMRLAGLLLFIAAILAALVPLLRFRWPDPTEVDHRIERVNRLAHAPIRAQHERLAGEPDAFAETLWRVHKERLAARLGRLSGGMPRTGLPDRDPYGLRSAVALLVVIAFAWSLGPYGGSVRDAWQARSGSATIAPRVDAWVTPPAYTGRAPLFLAATDGAAAGFEVPAGSVMTARVSGGSGRFALGIRRGDDPSALAEEAEEETGAAAGAQQFAIILDGEGEVALTNAGVTWQSWPFATVTDQPPAIRFTHEPRQAANGALELRYALEDDYGIAAARAEFSLATPEDGAARPLFDAPEFPLAAPRRGGEAARTSRDLTAHPWAGASVNLQLKAVDDAGQEGVSERRQMVLPERRFSNPLARAVIEQRRMLALDANARRRVLDMLEAILLWPENTVGNAAHFLALSVAQRRLERARTDERLREVVDYLWEVARGIEDGALSAAERRLSAAQEALREALEQGAAEEEIEELMAELRQAMEEFLREFAERAQQDPDMAMQMPSEAMEMSPGDLERMLDRIEELAKSGAQEQAQELLSQLQDMMNNLQAMNQGQQGGPQDEMRQQMDQLGDLMRRQQELMNETFRTDQMRRSQQGQRGRQGQRGQGGMTAEEFADAMRRLQEGQGQLQDELGELMDRLGDYGLDPGEGFGEAGEHMGNAGRALGQGAGEAAVGEQGEALQSLRRGAQEMMNQMQQQAGEGTGAGIGSRSGGDRDPLGRPRATTGPDFGDSVNVPDEIDVQRARRILEAIRERLGDALSPALEREYLERLLELR